MPPPPFPVLYNILERPRRRSAGARGDRSLIRSAAPRFFTRGLLAPVGRFVSLGLLAFLAPACSRGRVVKADLILTHGVVHRGVGEETPAEAIAISPGRIIEVGGHAQVRRNLTLEQDTAELQLRLDAIFRVMLPRTQ